MGGTSSFSVSSTAPEGRLRRFALASMGDAAPASSASVFQAPQAEQRPDHRGLAVPQDLADKFACALAMMIALTRAAGLRRPVSLADVDAVITRSEACQNLVADRAGERRRRHPP